MLVHSFVGFQRVCYSETTSLVCGATGSPNPLKTQEKWFGCVALCIISYHWTWQSRKGRQRRPLKAAATFTEWTARWNTAAVCLSVIKKCKLPALSVVQQDRPIPRRDRTKTVFLPFAKSLDMTILEREKGSRRPLSQPLNVTFIHSFLGLYRLSLSLLSGNCPLSQRCNRIARSPAETQQKRFFALCKITGHDKYGKGWRPQTAAVTAIECNARSFIFRPVSLVVYSENVSFVGGATGLLDPLQSSKKNIIAFSEITRNDNPGMGTKEGHWRPNSILTNGMLIHSFVVPTVRQSIIRKLPALSAVQQDRLIPPRDTTKTVRLPFAKNHASLPTATCEATAL